MTTWELTESRDRRPRSLRRQWPIPDQPGKFGSRFRFLASQARYGQWIFWQDRVEALLGNRIDFIYPLHAEVHASSSCNYGCSWCSVKGLRRCTGQPSSGQLQLVVKRLAEHGIGIQWTGGEPLCNAALLEAMKLAAEYALPQCVFTNGSLLDDAAIRDLVRVRPVFVRVSLNAVTRDVHRRLHRYSSGRDYCSAAKNGLKALVSAARGTGVSIGVSVVFNHLNVQDLPRVASFVADLPPRNGDVDIFVVVRPIYDFSREPRAGTDAYLLAALKDWMPGGAFERPLRESGISVVVPCGPPGDISECRHYLACSLFIEVGPSAEVYLCSDRYGDQEYEIGNLRLRSLAQIMHGRKRLRVLRFAEEARCLHRRCPRYGRGATYNYLFQRLVQAATVHPSRTALWLDALRTSLRRPEHSFFM